jgi:1,4-dihydroxy-2-naphthoyl-CoA hydrolase
MAIPMPHNVNDAVGRFDRLYGLELISCTQDEARAQVRVRDDLKQIAGLLHGGVLASVAESLTSIATAMAVLERGEIAMGLSNNTSFLRPVTGGTVSALATRLHRGRTTWVWDVRFTDEHGKLCAVTRMTVAVRPIPS